MPTGHFMYLRSLMITRTYRYRGSHFHYPAVLMSSLGIMEGGASVACSFDNDTIIIDHSRTDQPGSGSIPSASAGSGDIRTGIETGPVLRGDENILKYRSAGVLRAFKLVGSRRLSDVTWSQPKPRDFIESAWVLTCNVEKRHLAGIISLSDIKILHRKIPYMGENGKKDKDSHLRDLGSGNRQSAGI